jgi:hypothetical protein
MSPEDGQLISRPPPYAVEIEPRLQRKSLENGNIRGRSRRLFPKRPASSPIWEFRDRHEIAKARQLRAFLSFEEFQLRLQDCLDWRRSGDRGDFAGVGNRLRRRKPLSRNDLLSNSLRYLTGNFPTLSDLARRYGYYPDLLDRHGLLDLSPSFGRRACLDLTRWPHQDWLKQHGRGHRAE